MRAITLIACVGILLTACQSPSTGSTVSPKPASSSEASARPAQPVAKAENAAPQEAAQPTQATPAEPQTPAEPAEPTQPEVGYGEGPLRMAVTAMREQRFKVLQDEEMNLPPSDFRMQVRIMGADMLRIKQIGSLILTEAIDSTGKNMVSDDLYTQEELTVMRRMPLPSERLQETGLLLTTKANESARGATTIKSMKGYVRAILAEGETQPITVLNPLQYQDEAIVSDQLAQAGIEAELVPLEQVAQPLRQAVVIRYASGGEQVDSLKFYDGWMKELRARERPVQLKDGGTAFAYVLETATLDNEMQVVFNIWPEIEDIRIPLDQQDVPLP
jgi:hypothetical protein